jgi:hydroxyquinol 1,2-dioxygenase
MSIETNRNLRDAALTEAVLASFGGARSPRLRQIAERLVTHLHAFVAEVELTEEEWFSAIDFLTRTGHITDERRQEFVLLSDVLGVSMQVIGINHRAPSGATESTVFGPFFVEGSPGFEIGEDIAAGAPGQPCFVSGSVRAVAGEPVAGALVEVWQADADGFYDVQYDGEDVRGRGHLSADAKGRFSFWTVLPEAYPIPDDGPVGELLAAAGRSPMRPAHVHFMIDAPGYARLITHVFAAGDEHLGSDAVFGVKDSLIAEFERHEAGTGPGGRELDVPWYSMDYEFVLAPQRGGGGA